MFGLINSYPYIFCGLDVIFVVLVQLSLYNFFLLDHDSNDVAVISKV
jgi:hypothetical protein